MIKIRNVYAYLSSTEKNLLILITILSILLRFWKIGELPLLFLQPVFSGRVLSASLGVLTTICIYVLAKIETRNARISLLASWVFAVLPWTIEQGRIVSGASLFLFILVICFLIIKLVPRFVTRFVVSIIILFGFYKLYPNSSIFRLPIDISFMEFTRHVFALFSFDMFFFRNETFWWGGIREFGMVYLSFLPFFVVGLYQAFFYHGFWLVIGVILLGIIASLNPYFPEGREFYASSGAFALFCAYGFQRVFSQYLRGVKRVLLALVVSVIFFYEMSQFLHYYTIHYSQEVVKNQKEIHEPF